jgi:hypothetical protein
MPLGWPAPVEVSLWSFRLGRKETTDQSIPRMQRGRKSTSTTSAYPRGTVMVPVGRRQKPHLSFLTQLQSLGIRSTDNGMHTINPGDATQTTEAKDKQQQSSVPAH